MPHEALSTYAYSPYKGTYAVLTGSGILVKKLFFRKAHQENDRAVMVTIHYQKLLKSILLALFTKWSCS